MAEEVRRAFAAGQAAWDKLEGITSVVPATPPIACSGTLRNRIYIILRGAPATPAAGWTGNYGTYITRVSERGSIEVRTVSHAFPSLSEAEAYALGAGRVGLPDRLD